ncbi:MAG TPA: DoxX family protein [Polyangiaceae bacterium]|jgi:putative oxidoreductase
MPPTLSAWFVSASHDDRRSVDLVRIGVAIILLTHPLHAFVHPSDAADLARGITAHGLPLALPLAWVGLVVQAVSAVALLVPRFVVPGALGSLAVVAGGALFVYAPTWYVVGGWADDEHLGVEFHFILLACLAGVLWTYWPRAGKPGDLGRTAKGGLEIVRVASALSLLAHGAPCFVTWDVAGMHGWGERMTELGWPCGVALVWSIKSIELSGALLRLSRRLMVPACLGHLSYLVPALWIEHHLHWWVLVPGQNGIEFSLMLILCSVACILAYWPARRTAVAPARAPSLRPERAHLTSSRDSCAPRGSTASRFRSATARAIQTRSSHAP